MAKQTVNIGSVPNDSTGDSLRVGIDKLNDNDSELYSGAHVAAAVTKTTPVDADVVGIQDSAASNILKKISWGAIKAAFKTYFDTLYLMDSEVTNLAQVKAFDASDYATSTQGTTAAAALPKAGGAMTGAITTNSTFDGRDVATDGTKLDGIAIGATVNTGTIGGGGTGAKIPVYSGSGASTTISDSPLTVSGTTVTAGAALNATGSILAGGGLYAGVNDDDGGNHLQGNLHAYGSPASTPLGGRLNLYTALDYDSTSPIAIDVWILEAYEDDFTIRRSSEASTAPRFKINNLGNFTLTGTVTAPTFIGALTGNATTATALETTRAINGVNFDGSADITITANANLAGNLLTAVPSGALFTGTIGGGGTGAKIPVYSGSGSSTTISDSPLTVSGTTVTAGAALNATGSILAGGGLFAGVNDDVGGNHLQGNLHAYGSPASTPLGGRLNLYTALDYDSTSPIAIDVWILEAYEDDFTIRRSSEASTAPRFKINNLGNFTLTGTVTASGTVTAPTFIGALTGNATTATALATTRAINGVNFDGSAAITITANANLAGNLLTAVPSGALFTDTTYSVGDGGLTQVNFTTADNTKLDGIETGATADQTAAQLLTAIKTVDGAGSGLDADLLDGISSASFLRSNTADTSSQRITFTACATNNWDTIATASGSQGGLEVQNSGSGNDAFMSFHAGADFALYFGLDADINDIAVGGWSMGANKYRIWHAGNDGSGSGLDADLLKGLASTTLNTVNTIAVRDGSGDIHARLLRQQYTGTTTLANYIMTQVSLGTGDNYLRACPMSSFRTTLYAGGIHVPGGGAVATNEAFGTGALASNTTGAGNTASGYQSLEDNTSASNNTASGAYALNKNTTGYHNTAIGRSALYTNTTGVQNTASGYLALYTNTSGGYNTATGVEALRYNTTGELNAASGYRSLTTNTTGHSNAAYGVRSLNSNTTGHSNVANGYGALYTNTGGYYNVANGFESLYLNTTGYRNVATGYKALYSNTTATNNTATGYESLLSNTTGANNTGIGRSALSSNTTGGNNTALGYVALSENTTGHSNTASGYAALWLNTEGHSNTANGFEALYYNTTGNSNVANGYRALRSNTTGYENTANGSSALYTNTTGIRNIATGYKALYANTTGGYNVANGQQALQNNTTASYNVASGYLALYTNTTGANNTANGTQALRYNITGASNTASGYYSLYANTTGSSNVANGYEALRYNTTASNNTANGRAALRYNTTGHSNTANGYASLYANTTGTYNTATGYESLRYNTTGGSNTASGRTALRANTTGGYNTAHGMSAMYTNTTGHSNIAIGYAALWLNTEGVQNTATGKEALRSNTTASNNTASGYLSLYANTTGASNTAMGVSSLRTNTTGVDNAAHGVNSLYYNTTGRCNTAIGSHGMFNNTTGSGNIGIGGFTSGASLSPVINLTIHNNRIAMGSTGVTNAYVQVAWTVVSDARDKTDFAPVPHGLDFVSQLKPTTYRYKMNREDTEGHGPLRYGFKAQEVLELEGADPVIVDAEDEDKLRFNDQSMIAVLVNALQELNDKFDAYVKTHP